MKIIISLIEVIFCSLGRLKNRIFSVVLFSSIMLISTACSHEQHSVSDNHLNQDHQQVKKEEVKVEEKNEAIKATPENIKSAVFETLGFNEAEGEKKISDVTIQNEDEIILTFIPNDNVSEQLISFTIKQDIANILLGIKKSNVKVKNVQIISTVPTVDQSGSTVQKDILNVTYSSETINQIDFESSNTDNILSMADIVTYLNPVIAQ